MFDWLRKLVGLEGTLRYEGTLVDGQIFTGTAPYTGELPEGY
jgi:hypothetical protein